MLLCILNYHTIMQSDKQGGAMQVARKSKPVDLMAFAAALQKRHEAATTVESRKEKGQVFTPAGVCRFMAGLFTRIPDRFRLLDAGAGVGSLAAAFCERVLTMPSSSPARNHAV